MHGLTIGDLVRLGSTDLWVKIEKDYIAHGDECTFRGGKTLRHRIGQAAGCADDECADLVLVNAFWSGIFKADIGVKDGVIVGIGKTGNHDVMDEVNPAPVIGSKADIIAAEGRIITAGGIDIHVMFACGFCFQGWYGEGLRQILRPEKQVEIVKNTRTVTKLDMKFNNATPKMEVDAEAFTITADGVECKVEAATPVPLAHQCFIY
ncbi:hypothetical protein N7447_005051 [Penicillium robsamsonii]|uniref:uncharacterized protein n=1 Tax=Penicillium robsamsonii TaxID=1792511 RepID=UPI0025492EC2|nr:uncharacterized protein N7447_005051 [Penicillium robsamsonii]KAJ5822711.1 hypothetical protein N7447_005051 [Penicillium robsamsonii]